MRRINVVSLFIIALVCFASFASAASNDLRCLSARTKAQAKYHSCVQKVLARVYGGSLPQDDVKVQDSLSQCRAKYVATWDKLVLLNAAPCADSRFQDNGDGTVTDNLTGLVWQKTDDAGGLTDKDNGYAWGDCATPALPGPECTLGIGTGFTAFLAGLNSAAGFAGTNDWRIPTLEELLTILLEDYPCGTSPCIDQAVFGPAGGPEDPRGYFSSTTAANGRVSAWGISFYGNGSASYNGKWGEAHFRAVRSDGW